MKRSMHRRFSPLALKEDGRRGEAALIGALLYMILVAAVLVVMNLQNFVGQKTTRASRDYLLANQMANMALSDALFQMNEKKVPEASFPLVASKDSQCGEKMETSIKNSSTAWSSTNLGCGKQSQVVLGKSAKWQWYVERVGSALAPDGQPAANQAMQYRVYATGGFNQTMRTITSDLYSMDIRSAFNDPDTGTIIYDTAPSSVFSHTVFAGTEALFNNATITGSIGTNGVIKDPTPSNSKYTGTTASPAFIYDWADQAKGDIDTRCYLGDPALAATKTKMASATNLCFNPTRIASQMKMDQEIVNNAANTCNTGSSSDDWKASDYANPTFYATGDMACYRNVTFDKTTTVIGTKTFGIVATGKISISAAINAPSNGSLILYHSQPSSPGSTGLITFTDSTPATPTALNLYIYSPNGTCNFAGASIKGGIACDKVSFTSSTLAGKSISSAVNQPGFSVGDASLFNRTIWYLGNFDEQAAKNPRQ